MHIMLLDPQISSLKGTSWAVDVLILQVKERLPVAKGFGQVTQIMGPQIHSIPQVLWL